VNAGCPHAEPPAGCGLCLEELRRKNAVLAAALEDIRSATFKPYQPPDPRSHLPTTMKEKLYAWGLIQSIAARALRENEDL
jgi:hypothetical protein